MAIPGYRVRLHAAFTTPIMLGGVPREFAILNWTICFAFVLGAHAVVVFPFFILLHLGAIWYAKKDPQFFAVILRHSKQKKFYRA